eukprot:GHVN01041587.1.p1 GENE.GHVN01041587.1~~GHVN01041587.1.p1  ORF type:complete len:1290 (-),score=271.41 GHVN01041587.1:61-3549(-)
MPDWVNSVYRVIFDRSVLRLGGVLCLAQKVIALISVDGAAYDTMWYIGNILQALATMTLMGVLCCVYMILLKFYKVFNRQAISDAYRTLGELKNQLNKAVEEQDIVTFDVLSRAIDSIEKTRFWSMLRVYPENGKVTRTFFEDMVPAFLVTVHLFFDVTLDTCLSGLVCSVYGGEDSKELRLSHNPAIVCSARDWKFMLNFSCSLIGFLIWAIGVPVGAYFLVKRHAQELGNPAVRRRIGWVCNGYSINRYWWECIVFLRRVFIAVVIYVRPLNMEAYSPMYSSVNSHALCVCALFLALQLVYTPFDERSYNVLNLMETIGMSICLFSFLSIVLIEAYDDEGLQELTPFATVLTCLQAYAGVIAIFAYLIFTFVQLYIETGRVYQYKWYLFDGPYAWPVYTSIMVAGLKIQNKAAAVVYFNTTTSETTLRSIKEYTLDLKKHSEAAEMLEALEEGRHGFGCGGAGDNNSDGKDKEKSPRRSVGEDGGDIEAGGSKRDEMEAAATSTVQAAQQRDAQRRKALLERDAAARFEKELKKMGEGGGNINLRKRRKRGDLLGDQTQHEQARRDESLVEAAFTQGPPKGTLGWSWLNKKQHQALEKHHATTLASRHYFVEFVTTLLDQLFTFHQTTDGLAGDFLDFIVRFGFAYVKAYRDRYVYRPIDVLDVVEFARNAGVEADEEMGVTTKKDDDQGDEKQQGDKGEGYTNHKGEGGEATNRSRNRAGEGDDETSALMDGNEEDMGEGEALSLNELMALMARQNLAGNEMVNHYFTDNPPTTINPDHVADPEATDILYGLRDARLRKEFAEIMLQEDIFYHTVSLAELYMACLKLSFLIDTENLMPLFVTFAQEKDAQRDGGLSRLRRENVELEKKVQEINIDALRSVDDLSAGRADWLEFLFLEEEAIQANKQLQEIRKKIFKEKEIALTKRRAAIQVKQLEMGLQKDLVRHTRSQAEEGRAAQFAEFTEMDLLREIEETTEQKLRQDELKPAQHREALMEAGMTAEVSAIDKAELDDKKKKRRREARTAIHKRQSRGAMGGQFEESDEDKEDADAPKTLLGQTATATGGGSVGSGTSGRSSKSGKSRSSRSAVTRRQAREAVGTTFAEDDGKERSAVASSFADQPKAEPMRDVTTSAAPKSSSSSLRRKKQKPEAKVSKFDEDDW